MSDAKSTQEASQWCQKARELLGKRRSKKLSLKSNLGQAKEANDKLDKRLRQLGEVNGPEHQRQLVAYKKLAGELHDLAQANDEAGLMKKLNELDGLQKTVEAEIKKAKELAEAVAKFEKAYGEREVEMAKVRGLRGATLPGSSVHKPLQLAVAELGEARRLGNEAWTERDTAKLTQANEKLKAVGTQLGLARDGVKNVKSESQADLAAQGEWNRILPLAREALVGLRKLPGAEASVTWLQKLIDDSVGLLVNEAGVMHGFSAALEKLKGYAAVVTTGEEASKVFLAKDKPIEVIQALARVTGSLSSYEAVRPSFAVDAVREEANGLAERGRREPAEAVRLLDALAKRVQDDTTQGSKEMNEATLAQTAIEDLIASLKKGKAPESLLASAERAAKLVDEGDFAALQWVAAKAAYERAGRQLRTLEEAYKTHGTDWELKRSKLAETTTRAQQAMSFPALQHMAQRMLEACAELKKHFDRFDFEASRSEYDKPIVFITGPDDKTVKVNIADARTELDRIISAGKVPIGDDQQRKAFDDALPLAHREVFDAQMAADTRVNTFINGQQGLSDEDRDSLLEDATAKLSAAVLQWQNAASGLTGDLTALAKAVEVAVKALAKVATDLEAMALSKLKQEAGAVRHRKASENDNKAPELMAGELKRLKALGIDVAAEELLVNAQKDAPTKSYRDIYVALRKKEVDKRNVNIKARNKLRDEMQKEVRQPMQDLQVSVGYKKELERQGRDVLDLINTQDMDLLDTARDMKERLQKQVDAIQKAGPLHAKNKDDLDKLGARIGKLLELLPSTARRLQQRHVEEIAETKRCAPTTMKARIAILTQEVLEGEQTLKDREAAIVIYRRHKTEAREAFKALQDEAGKGDAFEKWFDARIVDAKALKATESGIPDAIKLLEEIKSRIAQIRASGNPKAAMAEANAEEQQHHRLMLDLSRQWQQELASFLTDTLEEAREAVKESKDGDESTIKGLEDLANGANKQLEPYLKNLDRIGFGALSGPDLKKMKADFDRARQTLANARGTAQRLTVTPQTTNVQGPSKDGITRLHRKWSERTRAYAASLSGVAKAVGDAAGLESDDELKSKGQEAARLITSLTTMFQAEAFSTAFGVLLLDADGDTAIQRQQLAARETVLRQVRQYRADLDHPLLHKLTSRANPIDSTSVLVAVSGLETTLKEIELQALASA